MSTPMVSAKTDTYAAAHAAPAEAAPVRTAGSRVAGCKVWVVGINYAPDQVGIAPYTTQLAEALHDRGASVDVTTGVPHYPGYEIAEGYKFTLSSRELINGVRVRRLRHSVPREMTAGRRAVYEATFLAHTLLRRPPTRPDVIVGVTPALSGAISAAMLSRRLKVPLLIIVQDLVGPSIKQSGINGGKWLGRLTRKVERWAFRNASTITVLHDGFRPYVHGSGIDPAQVRTVRNWSYAVPAVRPRHEVRAEHSWPDDVTVVLYAGNMGLKMDLSNVIQAGKLAEQRGEKVLFVLLGDGSQRADLAAEAEGVSTVRFAESRYGSDFADTLAAADILLVNERPSLRNMSLPSKLAYYFTSGRPVLAAVASEGTTAREVEKAGAGIVVPSGDPERLLEATLELAADEQRCVEMGRAGQAYALAEYDRGNLLNRFEHILGELIDVPATSG